MRVYGIIYCITCLITGMKYVGQTTQRLKKRIDVHKFGDLYIDREIQKYGWSDETFKVEVLEECYSREHLNEREKFWIKELNSKYPNGYNKTSGGKGTDGHKCSDETRAKKSALTTGEKNPFFGKHHSAENKSALSIDKRGESPYKNLLAEMDKLLLSYRALAKLLGISQAAISFKMSGKRKFTAKDIAKLEKIFGLPLEYLLARDDGERALSKQHETPFKNLLALMEEKKMSYTDLAKLLGLSQPTISGKMLGKYNFTAADKARLVEIFQKPIKYLLERTAD